MGEKIIFSLASVSFHLREIPRGVKFIETKRRMVVVRGCGQGGDGVFEFNGDQVSLWVNKESWS